MSKRKFFMPLGAMLLAACAVNSTRGDSEQDRTWYVSKNKAGVPASEIRPPSVPVQVRQAFRAASIAATHSNSWICWVNAWPKNGGTDGRVYVEHMTLEAIAPVDSAITLHVQRYVAGEPVWGGWFPYNDRQWYQLGMRDENDFSVGEYQHSSERRFTGAIIDVGRHANIPACGHIWMKRWPRDVAPASTVRMRLRVRFVVTGQAYVNVGMDRYRLRDADPAPQQEVLVSDTYSAEHGIVDVVMDTVDITWQP